jgi:uncharacterized protein (DUF486 family)
MTRAIPLTIAMLSLSNVFMTFAWYAHLKELYTKPWIIAALVSWGIALSVFVPFAYFYLKEPLKLDYLWAALCILGAVYFVFRSKLGL